MTLFANDNQQQHPQQDKRSVYTVGPICTQCAINDHTQDAKPQQRPALYEYPIISCQAHLIRSVNIRKMTVPFVAVVAFANDERLCATAAAAVANTTHSTSQVCQ